jgi:hypothetical protein
MRLPRFLVTLAGGLAALFLLMVLSVTFPAAADQVKPADPGPSCTCPSPDKPASSRPKYADTAPLLDENDEIAALEAIRVALTEVADGSTYVWHRTGGRLGGIVRPTVSFKDAAGRVCRHIELMLAAGTRTARIEGIACRLGNGRWQLDG